MNLSTKVSKTASRHKNSFSLWNPSHMNEKTLN